MLVAPKLAPVVHAVRQYGHDLQSRRLAIQGIASRMGEAGEGVMTRPSWDEYGYEMAHVVSKRATCPRASIGAVIMNSQHRIIATGFNGAATGQTHCTDVGCLMIPGADHCLRATHAEINAANQVSPGMRNLTAYVVGGRDVCSHCAGELYAVGVREIKSRPAVLRLDDVLAEVNAWQRETFPHATPKSVVEHLRREAYELWQHPHDQNEWADVLFLLAGAADLIGTPLADVVARKLDINRARTWGEPDELGVSEHVRSEVSV